MKMKMGIGFGLVLGILAGGEKVTGAEVVAEWDFRVNEHLVRARPRAYTSAETNCVLRGDAAVRLEEAAGVGYRPALAEGYLRVPGAIDQGLLTDNAGGLAAWRVYFGSATFGEATLLFWYRPGFTGAPTGRRTLFTHRAGDYTDTIWLYLDGAQGLRLRLGRGGANRVELVSGPLPWTWDPDTWYYIAATFREADFGGAPTAALYARPLLPESPAYYQTTADPVQTSGSFVFQAPLAVGSTDNHNDAAQGDIAWVQLRAGYSPRPALEAYFSFAHEPQPPLYADEWADGFNPTNVTATLQGAIDSGATHVMVRDTGEPWFVDPIYLRTSDQTLHFATGVVVRARAGSFLGKRDALFSTSISTPTLRAYGTRRVTLAGYGAAWEMPKADYQAPPYEPAEWRHALNLVGASDIAVRGLTLDGSGGDGIYIGLSGQISERIHIEDVLARNHHRQGISITHARDVLVENSIFRDTAGTAPQCGADLEPNSPADVLTRIVFVNCQFLNNASYGILFWLAPLNAGSEPVDILFKDCIVSGTWGIYLGSADMPGRMVFDRSRIEQVARHGIDISNKSTRSDLVLAYCTFAQVGTAGDTQYPLIVSGNDPGRTHGGIKLIDTQVIDTRNRAAMVTSGTPHTGLHEVHGNLYVQNPHGARVAFGTTSNVTLQVHNGSAPLPPAPVPPQISAFQAVPGRVRFTWEALPPRGLNRIERATDLRVQDWLLLGWFLTDTETLEQEIADHPLSRAFYRLRSQ